MVLNGLFVTMFDVSVTVEYFFLFSTLLVDGDSELSVTIIKLIQKCWLNCYDTEIHFKI